MSDLLLEVRGLGVIADAPHGATGRATSLLDEVSLDVTEGSSVGVVGASGAGKSTLALALLGLLPPPLRARAGSRIAFAGRDLVTLRADALRAVRGAGIAMIFQEPLAALTPSMPAATLLAEALVVHHRAEGSEATRRATAMLDRVGIGADAARRFPHELSGGMRQRLMIAMALVLEPRLVVADEPTTALDPVRQHEMLDLLDTLRRASGSALLLISHDLDVVGERCERVVVLDAGRVVESGATADVLAHPTAAATRRLLAPRSRPRSAPPSPPRSTERRDAAERDTEGRPALLDVRDLSVTYTAHGRGWDTNGAGTSGAGTSSEVRAVDGISLSVRVGESVAVIGESGCGKTSLAHAILRLVPSRSTALRFGGADLARIEGEALRRQRRWLQFVPQEAGASLTAHLTCETLVSEGLLVHELCDEAEARRHARMLLEQLDLPSAIATALPRELSAGQRQRVAIARALAPEPSLLICDEPVSAVDPPTRTGLLDLLDGLRARRGMALLFISHDIPSVERIAERVLVMHRGRVVEEGAAAAVLRSPSTAYTRELLGAVPTGRPTVG